MRRQPPAAPGVRALATVLTPVAVHAGTTLTLAWGTAGPLADARAPGPAPVDVLVAIGAAAGAWLVLTWLAGSAVLTAATTVIGRAGGRLDRAARVVTPTIVRRACGVVLGVALAGAPIGPLTAHAEGATSVATASGADAAGTAGLTATGLRLPDLDRPASAVPGRPAPRATDHPEPMPPRPDLEGWTPDRPDRPPRNQTGAGSLGLVTTVPHRDRAVVGEVVVRRGDTLWAIAARHLGPDASAADIALEWPRWYAANRTTVGADPGLIRPGQQLRPPTT